MATQFNKGSAARRATIPSFRDSATASRGAPSPASAVESDTQHVLRRWRDVLPNDRMAHLVKDAIRALDRTLQGRLAQHKVSLGHWVFLRVLWETDGLTQRDLSREAGVMEPTTFAALKTMEARGYVSRRQLEGNRRKVHIFLTAKGRSLKSKLVPLAEEINRMAVQGVSAGDVAATRRTLLAVLENLARDELQSRSSAQRSPATDAPSEACKVKRPAASPRQRRKS